MDPLEQGMGPHGSRMGHHEGARTVELSLICLCFFFVSSVMYQWHADPMGPSDLRWGEALAPCAPLAAPLQRVPNTLE